MSENPYPKKILCECGLHPTINPLYRAWNDGWDACQKLYKKRLEDVLPQSVKVLDPKD